jgi:hypothetical protein
MFTAHGLLGSWALRFSTLRYATLRYATLRYSTLLYATLLYDTLRYFTLLYYNIRYYTILYATLLYAMLIYATILYSMRNKMPTTPTSVQPKSPFTTSLVPSRAKSARTTSRSISSCTMQVSSPSTRCPSSQRPWRPGKHSTAGTAEMRSATSSARPSSAATGSSTTA